MPRNFMHRCLTPLLLSRVASSESSAPAPELFVVTVYADQVAAPEGHVAPLDEAGGTQRPVEIGHQRNPDDVVAVADALHQRGQRGDLAPQHLIGEHLGNDAARSGDEAAGLRENHVVLNEMTLQDQVAVDLDDVFSAAGRNGLVADFRQPESVVLVPDMAYRYGRNRFEVADYVACGDARTVVGDDDFRRHDSLLHYAVEAQIEGSGPIVSGDDQRYSHYSNMFLGCLTGTAAYGTTQYLCRCAFVPLFRFPVCCIMPTALFIAQR